MTTSARVLETTSPLLEALDRELDPDSDPDFGSATSSFRGDVPWRVWHGALGAPLREFLGRPGKEFRGELTRLFFRIGGGRDALPPNLPLVVEVLHAGSLVVDDIEDESTERRGRPALHRIHGVPVALNAGNWLYFWATALMDDIEMASDARAAASRLTTRALLDCHYGQALDLSVCVSELEQSEVLGVVRAATTLKTGSLVGLAAGLGAIVGGGSDGLVAASTRFGRDLGTALQMLDDLSSVTVPRRAHKGREDLAHGRPTWPWAWLASTLPSGEFDALRTCGREVANGACPAALESAMRAHLAPDARHHIREHLTAARTRLASAPGILGVSSQSSLLNTLAREIERLEKSYG